MKTLQLLLLAFTLLCSTVNAQSPIAYWQMDETSGTTLSDASGNQQNATLNSADDNTYVSGKLNGAIHFDGARDAVVASADNLKPVSITLAAYVKADESETNCVYIN